MSVRGAVPNDITFRTDESHIAVLSDRVIFSPSSFSIIFVASLGTIPSVPEKMKKVLVISKRKLLACRNEKVDALTFHPHLRHSVVIWNAVIWAWCFDLQLTNKTF